MDASTEKGYSAAWVAEKVLEAVQTGQQEVVLFYKSCPSSVLFLCHYHLPKISPPGGAGPPTPPISNPPQSYPTFTLLLFDGPQG